MKIRLSLLMCLLCLVVGKVGAETATITLNASSDKTGTRVSWSDKYATFTLSGGNLTWNDSKSAYQLAASTTYRLTWTANKGYTINNITKVEKITSQTVRSYKWFNNDGPIIFSTSTGVSSELKNYSDFGYETLSLENNIPSDGYITITTSAATVGLNSQSMQYYLKSLELTYEYNPNKYTITFDANGGLIPTDGNMATHPQGQETSLADDQKSGTVEVTYGLGYFNNMGGDTPTYSDFIFNGWWTEDGVQVYNANGECTDNYWTNNSWSHTSDVTLKAHWKEKVNMKIGSSHFGTFCAPFDVTAPSGVKIYKEIENKTDIIRFQSQDDSQVIPAYTPVIVYSEGTVDEDFYGTIRTQDNCSYATLSGNLAPARAAENGSYVLNSSTEKPGVAFKIVDTSVKAVNVLKNRCYIPAEKAAKLKSLSISFEDGDGTTFISDFSKLFESEISTIYSASGIQLPNMQKGMNIVKYSDGSIKKVFVK